MSLSVVYYCRVVSFSVVSADMVACLTAIIIIIVVVVVVIIIITTEIDKTMQKCPASMQLPWELLSILDASFGL